MRCGGDVCPLIGATATSTNEAFLLQRTRLPPYTNRTQKKKKADFRSPTMFFRVFTKPTFWCTSEEAPHYDNDKENDPFSPNVVLDDVTIFEAAELDAIALLADMWDNDLDPKVSAQLVQASAQAYLSHGEGKGKGKGKSKGKGKDKGKFPFRPSCLPLDDRRQQLRELKSENRMSCLLSKRTLAHDRECAMFPSRLSSKPQRRHNYTLPANQRRLLRVSFFMDCGDNFETFVNTAGGKVSFSIRCIQGSIFSIIES